ncbi:ATP-binding protein [Bacillus paranthracis]|uniref:ATP-binding protein n=1 Tax=Bacillus paranthracis TaxID=2026186 RepID=UPI002407B5EC|nr:ATP-binding protein [Bacillus paranthracis]MDG0893667.1 ATP-binding protein [Bacillus paranthracis]MDG0932857.1 ATP-binding protein [Bacillus paranthracis]
MLALNSVSEFPINHVEDNLCFCPDQRVWSIYEVEGFEYEHQSDRMKKTYFSNQKSLFTQLESDFHLLVIPKVTDSDAIIDEHIARLKGPLSNTAKVLFEKVKLYLQQSSVSKENTEYHFFLLVQLNQDRKEKQVKNPVIETSKFARKFIKGFTETPFRAMGIEESDLLEEEISDYKEAEDGIYNQLLGAFRFVRRATPPVTRFLIEHNFTRGMTAPETVKDWNVGTKISWVDENGETKTATRPDREAILRLTECEVDEEPGRCIRLQRRNAEGDLEESYVSFLAVSDMDPQSHFPGREWIYRIQSHSLKFPVEVSIRAHHMENVSVLKGLQNSERELNDQRHQAALGGTVDRTVDRKAAGVKLMQDVFQTTGAPGLEMSVLFAVYAQDQKTLAHRVKKLITEYRKMKIQLVNPYGDQMAYFYEFFPGAKRYNKDFKIYAEPGVLAQGMFGATTQIGDNQGFYIGRTVKLNRPVFIRPDLAAKALENLNNEFDSLSVMIAGITGKGKSFLMNILLYWIVMSDGLAFCVDPKGDRSEWPKMLPGFKKNKDQLEVWTLGQSERDKGCLDPFRVSATKEDAMSLSLEVLTYLTGVTLENSKYDFLWTAIQRVAKKEEPCLSLVKDELFEMKQDGELIQEELALLTELVTRLNTIENSPLANLLFGKPGQDYRALDLERALQVLQIQHLSLPPLEQTVLSITDKLSESVLTALTAFGKSLMLSTDRKKFKVYIQDEAKNVMRNREGAKLSDEIIRKGRYHNTGLYLGTQNASDFNSANKEIANVGMKFSYCLKNDAEAKEMLGYYNLPVTDANIRMLQNLKRGHCLFQDIYGRTAVIKVDPVFKELAEAFDSSTKTAEEREQELAGA